MGQRSYFEQAEGPPLRPPKAIISLPLVDQHENFGSLAPFSGSPNVDCSDKVDASCVLDLDMNRYNEG
jgi:hypothetical protein